MRYHGRMDDEPVDPNAEKKEAAAVRGIGLTKAYVYIEEGEEPEDDTVNVSLADYFEGETTVISAKALNGNGTVGGDLAGKTVEVCKGKIAGIDLKTCTKNVAYPLERGFAARITVSYGGIEQSIDIGPANRNGWLDWSASE